MPSMNDRGALQVHAVICCSSTCRTLFAPAVAATKYSTWDIGSEKTSPRSPPKHVRHLRDDVLRHVEPCIVKVSKLEVESVGLR